MQSQLPALHVPMPSFIMMMHSATHSNWHVASSHPPPPPAPPPPVAQVPPWHVSPAAQSAFEQQAASHAHAAPCL